MSASFPLPPCQLVSLSLLSPLPPPCNSQKQYEDLAVGLVRGVGVRRRLSPVRHRLQRGRRAKPLFNTTHWVRQFERSLVAVWEVQLARATKGAKMHIFGQDGQRTFKVKQ